MILRLGYCIIGISLITRNGSFFREQTRVIMQTKERLDYVK